MKRSLFALAFVLMVTATATAQPAVRMFVDSPAANATVPASFVVAGWAFDQAAPSGPGVDYVDVWAFPGVGGDPVFLGSASLGVSRPDLTAAYGAQFATAGFGLAVPPMLPAGSYTLRVFAHLVRTGAWAGVVAVPVVVRGATLGDLDCAGQQVPQWDGTSWVCSNASATGATGAQGAAGPQGSTGGQGLVGPTGAPGTPGTNGTNGTNGTAGATGAAGGLSQYAHIYNLAAQVVAIEADTLFSHNGVITAGITHVAGTSQVTLVNSGSYEIGFSLSTIEPGQFALFLNGTVVGASIFGSGAGTQQNNGHVILVASAGDVITLRNHSSASPVTLQTLAGGTQTSVNASILIRKVN